MLEETGTEAELRKTVPDLKESLEIGRDDQPETPNMWPSGDDEAAQFKTQMMGFFETAKKLHMQVMRAIALGMGIDETWFDGFTDAGDNTLRLLHYPGVSKEIFKRNDGQLQVRAGEHSDYGMFPFLQLPIFFLFYMILLNLLTYLSRLHNPPLARRPRRSPSPLTKRHFRQRHTHPRHHCRQRRRPACPLVQRHDQVDQAPRCGAATQPC